MTSFSTVQVRLWPVRPLTQFQEEALVHDWHGALRSMGYQLLGDQLQLVIEREGELTSGDIVNVVWATSVLDGAVMLDVRAQSTSSGVSDLSELRLRVNLDHEVTADICRLYTRQVLPPSGALASLMALTYPPDEEGAPTDP